MNPIPLFECSRTVWVRYSDYTWVSSADGILYLTSKAGSALDFYNPIEVYEPLILDALQIGQMVMDKKAEESIRDSILRFVKNYGLLGIISALPASADFYQNDRVYILKNRFIRENFLPTEDYLRLFFPFDIPVLSEEHHITGLGKRFNGSENLSFHPRYMERYDWLKLQFKDWMYLLGTVSMLYDQKDQLDVDSSELFRNSATAYDYHVPRYHLALLDQPTILWDFPSLLNGIQMMFSFMLANRKNLIRICKQCSRIFVASRPNAVFCSPDCYKKHHAYVQKFTRQAELMKKYAIQLSKLTYD